MNILIGLAWTLAACISGSAFRRSKDRTYTILSFMLCGLSCIVACLYFLGYIIPF